MSITEKLLKIQTELKVPKKNYNSFSKYYYRSCEDILDAVKPLCKKNNVVLTLTDEICTVQERFYISATATVTDVETGENYSTTAYAREEENQKGKDGSQITGTASSYARKYALCGLFCIDDGRDPDSDGGEASKPTNKPASKPTDDKENKAAAQRTIRKHIADKAKEAGIPDEDIVLYSQSVYKKTPKEMSVEEAEDLYKAVENGEKFKKDVNKIRAKEGIKNE